MITPHHQPERASSKAGMPFFLPEINIQLVRLVPGRIRDHDTRSITNSSKWVPAGSACPEDSSSLLLIDSVMTTG